MCLEKGVRDRREKQLQKLRPEGGKQGGAPGAGAEPAAWGGDSCEADSSP